MTFSYGQLARRFERLPEFLTSDLCHLSLAGLVVLAGSPYPIPSRTRPLNSPAPMVLSLKAWKSRSLPGLPRTDTSSPCKYGKPRRSPARLFVSTESSRLHPIATVSVFRSRLACREAHAVVQRVDGAAHGPGGHAGA